MIAPEDDVPPFDAYEQLIEEEFEVERAFRARGQINNHTIQPIISWLVRDETGDAMFVTESRPFRDWWIEGHPGSTAEEVTGRVAEALEETSRFTGE